MLFDTDVLIWYLRGNPRAARTIQNAPLRYISVIKYMELLQGAKDKTEIKLIRSFLKDCGFETIHLTENIGHRAAIYVEEYALSSGIRSGDALIASTAVENNMTLVSSNKKHFKTINELEFQPFSP